MALLLPVLAGANTAVALVSEQAPLADVSKKVCSSVYAEYLELILLPRRLHPDPLRQAMTPPCKAPLLTDAPLLIYPHVVEQEVQDFYSEIWLAFFSRRLKSYVCMYVVVSECCVRKYLEYHSPNFLDFLPTSSEDDPKANAGPTILPAFALLGVAHTTACALLADLPHSLKQPVGYLAMWTVWYEAILSRIYPH